MLTRKGRFVDVESPQWRFQWQPWFHTRRRKSRHQWTDRPLESAYDGKWDFPGKYRWSHSQMKVACQNEGDSTYASHLQLVHTCTTLGNGAGADHFLKDNSTKETKTQATVSCYASLTHRQTRHIKLGLARNHKLKWRLWVLWWSKIWIQLDLFWASLAGQGGLSWPKTLLQQNP